MTRTPFTPRLVLVGSVLVDLVMPVAALPPRGGDVLAADATFAVGGGWYVLSSASAAGLRVAYAGRHGAGPNGDRVRAALAALGAELLLPPEQEGDTGLCVALVEPDGERTFVTHPGVEGALGAAALDRAVADASDVGYVSGYDLGYPLSGPAITTWLDRRPLGAPLVVDPGPLVAEIPSALLDRVLRRTTVLTLNRREARLLTGRESVPDISHTLRLRLDHDALLVVRDGGDGAHVTGRELAGRVVHVPADPVDVVDTTGAGDVHTGTLAAALALGVGTVEAVRRANAAAGRLIAAPRPR